MALNQSAINVRVINGAETTQFSQALNVTSTVTASFLRALGAIKSIVSTSTAILVSSFVYLKTITASLVTSLASIAQTGRGKILEASSSTINTIVNQLSLFRDIIATSNVVTTLQRTFGKLVLQAEVTVATILTATNRLLTLLTYSTANVSFIRAITFSMPLVSSIVTSIIDRGLILVRTITASIVSSTSTLIPVKLYYQILTVLSTTTSTLVKLVGKPLTILVNCGIILSKYVNKFITLTVTSTVTIIKSAISFIRFPLEKLIYAASKIRKVFYN